MSPESEERWERMERKVEFILEMQAQSEVRHAKLQEQQAMYEERQAKADARFERHVVHMRRLARMGAEMLRRQDERLRQHDEHILDVEKISAQLAAGQEELRASLKAFLDSMKKGSNGHN